MHSLAKPGCLIGLPAAIAVTASTADARVNTTRFGGAYASVPSESPMPGSTPYRPEGNPFPRGHGGTSASPDFQLMR
jgi:hypothetical protein